MKIAPLFYAFLVLPGFLLFVQCDKDNVLSIEGQKEELLNEFLDLSLNNNPLYDLYDTHELTVQECEKIIQKLKQGNALEAILPTYLSDGVNLQQVYEFFYQSARLTQDLRRYNVTESELEEKIAYYPISKTRHGIDQNEIIQTRSIFGQLNYNRCKRYCEDDYDSCIDQAYRSGFTAWGITVIGVGFGGAIQTGGLSILGSLVLLGPLVGVMTYGNESNYCTETYETCLIRCEEEK